MLWFFPAAWLAFVLNLAAPAWAVFPFALAGWFTLRRWWPLGFGVTLAVWAFFSIRWTWESIPNAATLILGLSTLATAKRYSRRMMELTLSFVLPVILVYLLLSLGFRFPRRLLNLQLLGPALGATLIAAIRATGSPVAAAMRPLIPLAIILVLIPGQLAYNRWREEQRRVELEAALSAVPAVPAKASYERTFLQRGVSFTSEGPRGYHPAEAAKLLDTLKAHGVDAVALVPYGSTFRDRPEIRFDRERRTWRTYEALANLARARGMRILLKPQLWGPGTFPGDVEMPDAESRRRWFAEYRLFVENYAALAAHIHADLFCVGTEFVKMSRHEGEWRTLIGRARELYPGPLVYAATQGEEFEQLKFWDALDYIGLNNYYPLPDSLDTSAMVAKVEAVQRRYGKPVIFPEVGFASVENAHRTPWAEEGPVDVEHQARCYRVIFEAFYRRPWFHGMYWWKIGTNGRGGERDHSFAFWRKPAWHVVGEWYRDLPGGKGGWVSLPK
jgi:hypothetical protein